MICMLSLRFPRLWLGLGWLAVALATLVCLLPSERLPQPPSLSDKTEHFLAYLLLSIWFAGIYARNRYWMIAVGLTIMGIVIEFAQGAMGLGRQGDIRDVIANSAGVVTGLLLCWFGLGNWIQWVESLVSKPQVEKS
jgi:VanZ family protein